MRTVARSKHSYSSLDEHQPFRYGLPTRWSVRVRSSGYFGVVVGCMRTALVMPAHDLAEFAHVFSRFEVFRWTFVVALLLPRCFSLALVLELPLPGPRAGAHMGGTSLLAPALAQRMTGPALARASAVPLTPLTVRRAQSHGVPQPPDPSTIRAVVTTNVHPASGVAVPGPRMLSPHEIDGPISAARARVRALRSSMLRPPDPTMHRIARPGGIRQPSNLRATASLGGSAYGAGTGINPWWRYTEQNVPGGGHVMANVGTGNVVLGEDDMAVPHKGIALAYRRTYNMQSGHDVNGSDGSWPTLQGNGWTTTWDAHLSGDPAHVITVWDIDGGRYDYTLAGDGVTWLAPPGQHATLTSDGACGVLWTKKSGTTYYFYALNGTTTCTNSVALYGGYGGRLNSIIGRNRNISLRMIYNWDNGDASTTGKIANITALAESGLQATLVMSDFNGHRLASGLNRPDGTVIYYSYDGNGNLTRVSSPSNNTSTSNIWHSFGYGSSSNGAPYMVWAASPRWVSSGANDGSYVYFGVQPVATSVSLSSIGHVGWVNPTINDGVTAGLLQPSMPTGAVQFLFETYTSGTLGTPSSPTIRDTDGHYANWVTDASGRATQSQECTATQNQQCTGTMLIRVEQWDADNNRVFDIEPRGFASGANQSAFRTDYAYDANGNTIAVAAPPVTTSEGTFRPTKLYDYDTSNNVTAYCDEGHVHRVGADWASPPTTSDSLCSSHGGLRTSFTFAYPTYEPYGELTTMTSPMGYTHQYSYDSSRQAGADYGLPTSVTGAQMNELDGTSVTPSQTFSYDAQGQLRCYSKGNGTYVLSYNAAGQITSEADPDDSSANSTSVCSKSSGMPNWNTQTTYAYYASGAKQRMQTPSERAYGVSTTYTYDADGNLVTETSHNGCVSQQPCPDGTTKKWYDGEDRLVEVAQPQDTRSYSNSAGPYDGDPWLTRYYYDLSAEQGVAVTASSGFQAYGNLFKTQTLLGPASGTAGWTDVRGSSFDAMDREVQSFAYSIPSHQLKISSKQYDATPGTLGMVSTKTNADGAQATYSYDPLGRTLAVAYTGDGGLTAGESYLYDPNGRSASVTSTQLGTEQRSYDDDGRLTTVAEPSGPATSGQNLTDPARIIYSYYGNGWKSALSVSSKTFSQSNAIVYSYRPDGALKTQAANAFQSGTWSKTLTDAGRLQTITGVDTQTRTYDTTGQLHTYALGGSTLAYAHDPEGSVETAVLPNVNAGNASGSETETMTNTLNVRGELIDQDYAPNTYYQFPHHRSFTNSGFRNTVVMPAAFEGSTPPAQDDSAVTDFLNGIQQRSSWLTTTQLDAGTSYETGTSSTFTFDASGRESNSDALTESVTQRATQNGAQMTTAPRREVQTTTGFDAENHTSVYHLVTRSRDRAKTSTDTVSDKGVVSLGWGPNGHPVQILNYTYGANYPNLTLHWDGDTLLFVTDASGSVLTFKVGIDGETGPAMANGMNVFDRDTAGDLLMTSNTTGHSGVTPLAPDDLQGPTLPASTGYMPNSAPGVGMFDYTRGDGFNFGSVRISGVRAHDPALGAWTTPDAYAGEIHDPASQQRYMWNRNNPYEYSDPSGYCPVCLAAAPIAVGGGLELAGDAVILAGGAAAGEALKEHGQQIVTGTLDAVHKAADAVGNLWSAGRPSGVPQDWKAAPTSGGGTKWTDPNNKQNQVRWGPPRQGRNDDPAGYYKQQINGRFYDKDGHLLPEGSRAEAAAHIAPKDFTFRP